ncbi:hypothetical protein [Nocardia alni]|uniref:hypothetical protein n=1 Tax=Nocardia alni TaxID=2815723 RepID=UPI001C214DE6|nr:hypothetical protein [Nocardia alni]
MLEKLEQRSRELLLGGGLRWQGPVVEGYVRRLRDAHTHESAEELSVRAERHYLALVTASGTTVGLISAVPGVGTVIGLLASGVEAVFFLEVSAGFAVANADLRGAEIVDSRARRDLVFAVVLGESGAELGERDVRGTARDWPGWVANRIPGLRNMDDSFVKRFIVRFAAKRAVLVFGRALPVGLGAVIGGVGNLALGRAVVARAHHAVGSVPDAESARPIPAGEPTGEGL